VVTVDTAMGHLAGALGKPVWILIPKAADWRWLLDRDDTPWYPTARLFRQNKPGAWDEPLHRLRGALSVELGRAGPMMAESHAGR
jgi:ADP-heptose:LPS heptosyltransferase